MLIYIRTLRGKTLAVDVESLDTVLDLKRKIEDMESVPVTHQGIVYRGKTLADHVTLGEAGISKEATLHLIILGAASPAAAAGPPPPVSEGRPIQIFIKQLSGKTMVCEMLSSRTIGELKYHILDREGIPLANQRLLFERRELADGDTLAACNIKNESILLLILRLPTAAAAPPPAAASETPRRAPETARRMLLIVENEPGEHVALRLLLLLPRCALRLARALMYALYWAWRTPPVRLLRRVTGAAYDVFIRRGLFACLRFMGRQIVRIWRGLAWFCNATYAHILRPLGRGVYYRAWLPAVRRVDRAVHWFVTRVLRDLVWRQGLAPAGRLAWRAGASVARGVRVVERALRRAAGVVDGTCSAAVRRAHGAVRWVVVDLALRPCWRGTCAVGRGGRYVAVDVICRGVRAGGRGARWLVRDVAWRGALVPVGRGVARGVRWGARDVVWRGVAVPVERGVRWAVRDVAWRGAAVPVGRGVRWAVRDVAWRGAAVPVGRGVRWVVRDVAWRGAAVPMGRALGRAAARAGDGAALGVRRGTRAVARAAYWLADDLIWRGVVCATGRGVRWVVRDVTWRGAVVPTGRGVRAVWVGYATPAGRAVIRGARWLVRDAIVRGTLAPAARVTWRGVCGAGRGVARAAGGVWRGYVATLDGIGRGAIGVVRGLSGGARSCERALRWVDGSVRRGARAVRRGVRRAGAGVEHVAERAWTLAVVPAGRGTVRAVRWVANDFVVDTLLRPAGRGVRFAAVEGLWRRGAVPVARGARFVAVEGLWHRGAVPVGRALRTAAVDGVWRHGVCPVARGARWVVVGVAWQRALAPSGRLAQRALRAALVDGVWMRGVAPVSRAVVRVSRALGHRVATGSERATHATYALVVRVAGVAWRVYRWAVPFRGDARDGFALCVSPGALVNATEPDTLALPFGASFAITLHNSNEYPCEARVTVDGEDVGAFLVPRRTTCTIRRPADAAREFVFRGPRSAAVEATFVSPRGVRVAPPPPAPAEPGVAAGRGGRAPGAAPRAPVAAAPAPAAPAVDPAAPATALGSTSSQRFQRRAAPFIADEASAVPLRVQLVAR